MLLLLLCNLSRGGNLEEFSWITSTFIWIPRIVTAARATTKHQSIGGEKEKNNKGEWSTFVSITSFPNCSKNKQWKLNILFAGLGSEIVKWWKVGSEK